jgi:broad specificity phosphatase PhoE
MKISLVRHGRPTANLSSRICAKGFSAWLEAYDEAGIDGSLPPPEALRQSLASCSLLVSSPARRATESANALRLVAERQIMSDAREAPLPTRFIWPFSHRPATFTVIARTLWLFGLARADEDKYAVRLRSRDLTRKLCSLSRDFGHVALVGHGYMNIFLRRNFQADGWRSSGARTNGYWSCCHFEKEEPNQALEPTTIAVTFRAFARPAPATVVAHL